MPSITIVDLNNAKTDVDHIADVSTSLALTSTDRLGNVKDTVAGAVLKIGSFNSRGAWTATTTYAVKDLVSNAGTWYVCVLAHTSSAAFATDSATKWRVYQGILSGDLSASSGSSLIGFQPIGTGTVPTTVQNVLRESFSVARCLPVGYVTDGSVDYTSQINLAISAANTLGADLLGVPGIYKVTGTGLPITNPINFDMRGMVLKNSAGNVLRVSGSAINLKNGTLYATGGTTVLQTGPVDQCNWSGMTLYQDSGNYSLWDNAGFDYVDMRHSNFFYQHTLGATVPGFKLVGAGGTINDNVWENGRCNLSGNYFFDVESNSANWQYSNSWKKITFEVCKGGGILLKGAMLYDIEDCQNWDCGAAAITRHFYSVQLNSSSFGSIGKFRNCGRWAGSNAGGVYDIQLPGGGGGSGTTIETCATSGGGDPFTADLQNNGVVCIASASSLFSTINNSGRVLISAQSSGIQFPGTVNGAFLTYYDEGTWTATLRGTTAAPTVPVTIPARWTRVGRSVMVEGVFGGVDLTGATGTLQITGLPFPVGTTNATGTIGLLGLGTDAAICIAAAAGSLISIVKAVDIGTGIPVVAAAGKYVYFSLKYTV